ncbi:MAG: hypothetical protein AAFV53_03725 [Myxococcota bacterium]
MRLEQAILAVGLSAGLFACSDARLQPLSGEVTYADDRLAVSGEFCLSPPEEIAFPVKLLIVIDQSASLQCTDPGNARLSALSQLGAELDPLPNVEFGVVGFASWSRQQDFTRDWATAAEALSPEGNSGGPATDYQGALSTVYSMLERDMIESGPATVARSRYVIMFVGDGIPEPRCRAGCDDGDTLPDSQYGVCNFTGEIPDDVYVDITAQCPEYNQPPQILQKVQDIKALERNYGAGSVTMSTVLLFAPEEAINAACGDAASFGYVRDEAEPLLRSMAEEGEGTYRDVNTTEDINFLDIDFRSLAAPYNLAEMFVMPLNAMPTEEGVQPDSDGDGLADAAEFAAGLDRFQIDSDGDLYSDLIEVRYANSGFDALDPTAPALVCADSSDRDGDGLLACEEDFLATEPNLPDTDGDRIPDGIEIRFGMDPLVRDVESDADFDGRSSGDELRAGTHPQLYDEDNSLIDQINYSVDVPLEEDEEDGCYSYQFRNIPLVETVTDDGDRGRNQIMLIAQEEPAGLAGGRGRFHAACFNATYLGESYKNPPSGIISDVAATEFVFYEDFNPVVDCIDPSSEFE